MKIDHVTARQILDTRGRPTIETMLSSGSFSATASVPSGKSTGKHEAVERRDADGSVASEVANENSEIAGALIGRDFGSLDEIDSFLIELDFLKGREKLKNYKINSLIHYE